jgi:phasin family protein
MFQNPEQFAAATKAMFEFQLETFNTLTNRAVQGLEQVVALNIATARSGLESGLAASKEFSQAGTPKAAMDAATSKLQPQMNRVLENAFYYLDNFQSVLDWIGERYATC